MNNLHREVNKLFKNYPHTPKVMEFKEELFSNLQEKVQDLIKEGYSQQQAIKIAVEDVKDFTIDGVITVNKMKYKTELAQLAFIYSLIGLILSIPLMLYSFGRVFNFCTLIITLGLGIRYVGFKSSAKVIDDEIVVDINKIKSMKKLIWILWGTLFTVIIITATAVQFGSNVWFGTAIKVDGPYALGELLSRYYIPLITILIPFYFNHTTRFTLNYRGDELSEF